MGKESRRNGGPVLANPFKKRNDGPTEELKAPAPEPVVPTELPPLRTFVVRKTGCSWDEGRQAWGMTTPDTDMKDVPRTIYAHGLGIDEARMISFVVFFFVQHEGQQRVAQAQKLVVNADDWSEVEEINDEFPTMPKKGLWH